MLARNPNAFGIYRYLSSCSEESFVSTAPPELAVSRLKPGTESQPNSDGCSELFQGVCCVQLGMETLICSSPSLKDSLVQQERSLET